MRIRFSRPNRPLVYVVIALFCATIFVLYLQHRAIRIFNNNAELLLTRTTEQAAFTLASEIQRMFIGPGSGVIRTLNVPLRVDLLAQQYDRELTQFPQVDRFFLWTEAETNVLFPDEVLFRGRPSNDATEGAEVVVSTLDYDGTKRRATFRRDPELGRLIADVSRQKLGAGKAYLASQRRVQDRTYSIFLRPLWLNSSRTRRVGMVGFVVNLDFVRTTLFGKLYTTRFQPLIASNNPSLKLDVGIFDDAGDAVLRVAEPLPTTATRMPFVLRFYPEEMSTLVVSTVTPATWTLAVLPVVDGSLPALSSTAAGLYLVSGASILMMVLALVFAVQGNRRITAISRMQADLVAHVSHELKTPLSIISTICQTLSLKRASPAKVTQHLDTIQTEVARLSVLVEHILEFSRIEARRVAYEFETVDLASLVRETVDEFRLTQVDKEVRVTLLEDRGIDNVFVKADPVALEQVLFNLLNNAEQYSRALKEITVRLYCDGSQIVIEVADNGIGIDAVEVEHVFERFYRGAGAALNRHGFGLGLAIVRQIVLAHRGAVGVQSATGQGSTFRVRLPVLRTSGT